MTPTTWPQRYENCSRSLKQAIKTNRKDRYNMDNIAEQIATGFWRRNQWVERSELIQQARLADAASRRTFNPERGTPETAYRRAAIRRALWGHILHLRSPVSGSDRKALAAVQTGELPDQPGGDPTWCARVRVIVADLLAGEPLARDVLLLGFRPSEVADRDSIAVDQVYKSVARAKYRLRQSTRLADMLDDKLAQHTHAC